MVIDKIVLDVVKELNQTIVGDLKQAKADGKLSLEEAATIKEKAMRLIFDRLGGSYFKIIQKVFGSAWILISTKIEATLYDLKKGRRLEREKSGPIEGDGSLSGG